MLMILVNRKALQEGRQFSGTGSFYGGTRGEGKESSGTSSSAEPRATVMRQWRRSSSMLIVTPVCATQVCLPVPVCRPVTHVYMFLHGTSLYVMMSPSLQRVIKDDPLDQ